MSINKQEFVYATVHTAVLPGEAVKRVRELQGLSQNQLAKLSGITQPNISAIETGARQLGRERAVALAKALYVHPAVLLFPDFDIKEVA